MTRVTRREVLRIDGDRERVRSQGRIAGEQKGCEPHSRVCTVRTGATKAEWL